jgi:hypothetical protein
LKSTPIVARQTGSGNIRIVRYHSRHLVSPLVQDLVCTRLAGTTCVLTHTNEEALETAGFVLENPCLDKKGVPVLTFSRSFSNRLEKLRRAGYAPVRAAVNYIVFWRKEDLEKEIRIILPELFLEKETVC